MTMSNIELLNKLLELTVWLPIEFYVGLVAASAAFLNSRG